MKYILSVSPQKKFEGRNMSKIEKRLNIDFKELVIHPLYAEIAPELFMIPEQSMKRFNQLEENVQDYLAANHIKIVEQDGKHVIINGISQYLKLVRKRKKDAIRLRVIKRRSALRLCREQKMCCRSKRGLKRNHYAKYV